MTRNELLRRDDEGRAAKKSVTKNTRREGLRTDVMESTLKGRRRRDRDRRGMNNDRQRRERYRDEAKTKV